MTAHSTGPRGEDPEVQEVGGTPDTAILPARRPGEWPVSDELRAQYQAERARRELTLGAIKAHLQEQPSPRSVRTCARRWCSDIGNLAADVITARKNQENVE